MLEDVTHTTYLTLIAENPIFAGLSPRAWKEVLEAATTRTYAKGELIVRQGDPARNFHLLVDGRAKLLQVTRDGHQVLVRYIVPGQQVGLISVLGDLDYPLSIHPVVRCTTLMWSGEELLQLMERHPRISINALRVMVNRNQQRQQRYQELLTERVEQRLAQGLLRLADQVGQPEGDNIRIDLPLTREDLAEYTGTTLFSVSRILRRWEQDGFVESGRERVSLSDLVALRAIADGVDSAP